MTRKCPHCESDLDSSDSSKFTCGSQKQVIYREVSGMPLDNETRYVQQSKECLARSTKHRKQIKHVINVYNDGTVELVKAW